MKVEQFYNKNQFLIRDNGTLYLQSYDSMVAVLYSRGGLILGKNWDYSHTTLKHLYLFLNDYGYLLFNKDKVLAFNNASNKKAYIQKLIDNKIIGYNEYL